MGEPRAITYKEIKKGRTDFEAAAVWKQVGEISGAGHVPAGEDAAIDLTGIADAKAQQIDKLVGTKKKGD